MAKQNVLANSHKGIRNTDRPNGKAWKKHPKVNKVKKSQ